MTVNVTATEPKGEPVSFRPFAAQREILDAFMRADGHDNLTPVIREAVAFYIAERLRKGGEAVRVTVR